MGTRYKKKYYIYNHFDSYFSYLGKHLLEMINNDEFDEWLETFLALKIVTDEDIEKCMKYYLR